MREVTITRMFVTRVSDDKGSTWIEPELGQDWPEYSKLSWLLGTIYADTGLDITLTRFSTNWSITTPGLSFGSTKPGRGEFGELWHTLNTFASGYRHGKTELSASIMATGVLSHPEMTAEELVEEVGLLCPDHKPRQHRDGKPPWCKLCRLTAEGKVPTPHWDQS